MTGNRRQPQPYEAVVDRAADRVIASLPGVALPAARALVADASTRYTVRQLDEYLEAYPDALTSGSSAAPMMIQALARRLVDAGYPDVRVPGCLRCADQTQLRYKVDGGRICDRCQRLSRHAPCTGCGRDRLISTRDEQARPLCPSCAKGPKAGDLRAVRLIRAGGGAELRRLRSVSQLLPGTDPEVLPM